MMDETPELPGLRPDRLLDAGALRALAHPLRLEIYDILTQYGPQTASSLAARTGESSGSTSYHLRTLAKHDLIREIGERGTGRERWWERVRGGVSFTNPEVMRSPSGKAATQIVMHEFLTRRHQQLLQYIGTSLASPGSIDEDEALIATATLRLTPEQATELITRLQKVITEFSDAYRDQEAEGARPISVRTDVFPLPDAAPDLQTR